jgi:hypothetical protein
MGYEYHERLTLTQFTAFEQTALEFVPGLNLLIGENGSGKTHVLKALYAWQAARHLADPGRPGDYWRLLTETYGARALEDLLRSPSNPAGLSGTFGGQDWTLTVLPGMVADNGVRPAVSRPVFIPALELMAHARNMGGILRDYADFDRTCFDFLSLVTARTTRNGEAPPKRSGPVTPLLPGPVEWDEEEQRFYVTEGGRRLPFALAAEGLRKVAALHRLIDGGWLRPGNVLFWDEPEVSINPGWMDDVLGALVGLAQQGVQVFVATHSYVVLKQVDLALRRRAVAGEYPVPCRYIALGREAGACRATWADDFGELEPNAILDEYDRMLAEDWRLEGLAGARA